MSAQTEPETTATKVLSRALEIWAKGCQVIPLPGGKEPDESVWEPWITKRQTRDDVLRLFSGPLVSFFGIVQCSSAWSPVIKDQRNRGWQALLDEDIVRMHPDLGGGEVVEWLFTAKFEFFEQLESLRKAREAAVREAKAAEEKLKPPIGLPVTRIGEGDLDRLFADRNVIRMIAPILGIPEHLTEGGGFRCVLHPERSPSAHLYSDEKGHYMYACFHGRDERWIRPLPEVYYVQKTGNTSEKLKGPTLATWALRLLAEAGVLQPVDDVGLPDLKVGSDGERKVYEGLKLLFSVRWTYSPGEPTPFSWRFAEDWCGVAQATAGKAIQRFLKLGIIHAAGKHKHTMLFLPGSGKRAVRIRFGRKVGRAV
jgi:hypothetical protein